MKSRAGGYRVWGVRAAGGGATGAVQSQRPEVETLPVEVTGGSTLASAALGAEVLTRGYGTSLFFRYGLSGGGSQQATGMVQIPASTGVAEVVVDVGGLALSTGYEVEAWVFHTDGPFTGELVSGGVVSFTTPGTSSVAPSVVTLPPLEVGETTATLAGTVNPNGTQTTGRFVVTGPFGFSFDSGPIDCGSGSSAVSVSYEQTGLTALTDYTVQLIGTNVAGQVTLGGVRSFSTVFVGDPPEIVSYVVDQITSTTARVVVSLSTGGLATNVLVNYGPTSALGLSESVNVVAGTTSVELLLSGLSDTTTYSFYVQATNAQGIDATALDTFTTLAPGVAPTGNTTLPDNIGQNSVLLHAVVDANSTSTAVVFEYATTLERLLTSPNVISAGTISGASAVDVSVVLPGLLPFRHYVYRVVATNSGGVLTGQPIEFRTAGGSLSGVAGAATITPATFILDTSATISGTVTNYSYPTTWYFEYWVTGSDVSYTQARFVDAPLVPTFVVTSFGTSENLTGLIPNTTYNYRLCVVNGSDPSVKYGVTQTLTTLVVPPDPVATGIVNAPTGISSTTVRISGTCNPQGTATNARYQASTTADFAVIVSQSTDEAMGSGTSEVSMSQATLTGLSPTTLYYFRCRYENASVSYSSNVQTASTNALALPTVSNVVLSGATATTLQATATVTVPSDLASGPVYWWMEYGTTTQASGSGYDVVTQEQPLPLVAGSYLQVLQLGGPGSPPPLVPATTYYCRVKARNAAGTVFSAEDSEPTTAGSGGADAVPVAGAATQLTPYSFLMNASVLTNGSATDVTFEFSEGATGVWQQRPVYGPNGTPVTRTVADQSTPYLIGDHTAYLSPASATWQWRVKAVNGTGVVVYSYGSPVVLPAPTGSAAQLAKIADGTYRCRNQTGLVVTRFLDSVSARLRVYLKHGVDQFDASGAGFGGRIWGYLEWSSVSAAALDTNPNRGQWFSYEGPDQHNNSAPNSAPTIPEMRFADYLTGLTPSTQHWYRLRAWSTLGEFTDLSPAGVGTFTTDAAASWSATWALSVGTQVPARNMAGPVPQNLRTGAGTITEVNEVNWIDAGGTEDYTPAEDAYTVTVTPSQIVVNYNTLLNRTQWDSSGSPNLAYALRRARVGDKVRMDGSYEGMSGAAAAMSGTISVGMTVQGNQSAGSWTARVMQTGNKKDSNGNIIEHWFKLLLLTGTRPTSAATITRGASPAFENIEQVGNSGNVLTGVSLYYSGPYEYFGCDIGGDANSSQSTSPANSIAYWEVSGKRYPITGVRVMPVLSTLPWAVDGMQLGNAQGGSNGIWFKGFVATIWMGSGSAVGVCMICPGQNGAGGIGVWGMADGAFAPYNPDQNGGWGIKFVVRSQSPCSPDWRRLTFTPSNEHSMYGDSFTETNPQHGYILACGTVGVSADGLKTYNQRSLVQIDARGDLSQNNSSGPGYMPGRGDILIKDCYATCATDAGALTIAGYFGHATIDNFTHYPLPGSLAGNTDQDIVINQDSGKGRWRNERGYSTYKITIDDLHSEAVTLSSDCTFKIQGTEIATVGALFWSTMNKPLIKLWDAGSVDNGYVRFTGAGTAQDALFNWVHTATGVPAFPWTAGWPVVSNTPVNRRIEYRNVGLTTPAEFQALQDGKQYTANI